MDHCHNAAAPLLPLPLPPLFLHGVLDFRSIDIVIMPLPVVAMGDDHRGGKSLYYWC